MEKRTLDSPQQSETQDSESSGRGFLATTPGRGFLATSPGRGFLATHRILQKKTAARWTLPKDFL